MGIINSRQNHDSFREFPHYNRFTDVCQVFCMLAKINICFMYQMKYVSISGFGMQVLFANERPQKLLIRFWNLVCNT